MMSLKCIGSCLYVSSPLSLVWKNFGKALNVHEALKELKGGQETRLYLMLDL